MLEWTAWVKQHLGPLRLGREREEEIVKELAHHFEDVAEEGHEGGLSNEEASRRASREVSDWNRFRKNIRRAENGGELMKHRIKSLWLPGLASAWLASAVLRIVIARSPHAAGVVWIGRVPMHFYAGWLELLPLVGALGAFASWSFGGTKSEILLAAAALPVVLTLVFAVGLLVALIVDYRVPLTIKLQALGVASLGWVILPGFALLIGTAPFIFLRRSAPLVPTSAR